GIDRAGNARVPIRSTVAHRVRVGWNWVARHVRILVDRGFWPAWNLVRRAFRSLARRVRVLIGSEPSPGGRLDALRVPKGWTEMPLNSGEVAEYYDDWNDRYLARFGPVLQTLRTQDPSELIVEIGKAAQLEEGQVVCDAGCGVGGPAIVLAEEFGVTVEGVTVSGAQVEVARDLIDEAGLRGRVDVRQGDFHRLERLYAAERFDAVLFMESFCHTVHPRVVLQSVWRVLEPGGVVVIKDLFRAPGKDRAERKLIETAARNTERHCHLQVRPREHVIEAVEAVGFALEVNEDLELKPEYDYDTGNTFVLENGIDIFEGQPSTYLAHAIIRARKPDTAGG
ncbi:MAG: methyltransferase domain-containing protein, partial [Actinomycetota bacterium]